MPSLPHSRTAAQPHSRTAAQPLNKCRTARAIGHCLSAIIAAAILTAGPAAQAATITLSSQPIPGGLRLTATEEVSSYFILQSSASLTGLLPRAMDMGAGGAIWDVTTAGVSRQFFNVRQVSAYAPEDSDGDYIDDVYEIQHPFLNPLSATDALLIVPGKSITYLQEYRQLYGLGDDPPQVYSREVSTFNFGAPYEAAISREVTAFNFGSPLFTVEALSREVTLFNGEGGPAQGGIPEVYTREVSLFNFGAPLYTTEVLSREVSLFNGEGGPAQGSIPELYSREVSTFNFGAPVFTVEAISREVSVFNNIAP
jgi:hypothetical protein